MVKKILVLPGDGIGYEVIREALKILKWIKKIDSSLFEFEIEDIGESAIKKNSLPLSNVVLEKASKSDAILFGAVGGADWGEEGIIETPESALLKLRQALNVYVNLRPVIIFDSLIEQSIIKTDDLQFVNFIFVRELLSDVYYGEPRYIKRDKPAREAVNTMYYNEAQIKKIAKYAFSLASQRKKKVCSLGKHNVLEVSQLWKEIIDEVSKDYPDVLLTHMYVDNANLQLIKQPGIFDIVLCSNLFGDIVSELAGALMGSLGCVPSASLNQNNQGIYEPIHGSAPDIAGKNIANPIGAILSVAMMFKFTFKKTELGISIEKAVKNILDRKIRTLDIADKNCSIVSTSEMGDAILHELIILMEKK